MVTLFTYFLIFAEERLKIPHLLTQTKIKPKIKRTRPLSEQVSAGWKAPRPPRARLWEPQDGGAVRHTVAPERKIPNAARFKFSFCHVGLWPSYTTENLHFRWNGAAPGSGVTEVLRKLSPRGCGHSGSALRAS